MSPEAALGFVEKHGVVLMSARGPVPSLAEEIAGEPIRGSWWGHPKSHEMFRAFGVVCDSDQVCVCRLVGGKVTFVHRRLWPAVVRLSGRLPRRGLATIREEHTPTGRHRTVVTPFPRWVPKEILSRGERLSLAAAVSEVGPGLLEKIARPKPARRRRPPRRAGRPGGRARGR